MTFSRRHLLAGAAAASAAVIAPLRPVAAATDADVVVVGAGAAGLAAAKALRAAGRSVTLVEARSRIGGRAFTDRSLGPGFDAGAHYIHWAERNPWTRLARDLEIPLIDEPWGDGPALFHRGTPLSPEQRLQRRRAFRRMSELLAEPAPADRSLLDAVAGAGPDIARAVRGLSVFSLGEEPDRVSLADYDQLWSGDDLVPQEGYGSLVARHGATIPVQLDTSVTRLRWDGALVEAGTPRGTLRARAAVVTVPVGVLKAEGIRFVPALPDRTRTALEGLGMGALTKIALKLDRAQVPGPAPADIIDIGEGDAVTSFEFWPSGGDLVLAILGGDHARGLCEAGEPTAVAYATERLAALLGEGLRRAVTGGRLAGWWTDPFSRGSYSIARPGTAGARQALREPIGGRIWLAGEATAGGGAMTVGGATLEGERAARDVLRLWRE